MKLPGSFSFPWNFCSTVSGVRIFYLKSGKEFKRRYIKTGAINADFAIVKEDLKENDVIALSDPFLKKEVVM